MQLIENSNSLRSAVFLSPVEVQKLLGYANRNAFWRGVRTARIPFIKINSRKTVFDQNALNAWLRSRTVGQIESHGVSGKEAA